VTRRTILSVNKIGGDQYSIQLTKHSDEPSFGAGSRQYRVRFDQRAVAVLQQQFEVAVDGATERPDTPGIGFDPFARLGRGLFDALLPSRQVAELRRELHEDDSPLLIITDDPAPLWEFMNDGEGKGFVCLQRDVGRCLMAPDILRVPSPRADRKWRCLMLANPTSDLPEAAVEAKLRQWFEQRDIDCSAFLEGPDANYQNVLKELLDDYDIIHYAGHVQQDPAGDYCMVLAGGEFLTPDNIRTFVKGGSIVFLNGCRSASAVKGLAEAFISVGARVVLGTLFDTPDEGGRVFAETFYSDALAGKPIGEAVRHARQSVLGHTGYGAAWACFIMYGDPTLRLDLKADELTGALKECGLTRQDIEPSACRVLEKALQFGAPIGRATTSHLFAAMVGGEDPHLSDRLRAAGVPPDRLQAAYQEVFRQVEHDGGGEREGGLGFSSTTVSILKLAARVARDAGRTRIGEKDLVGGFVGRGGGSAGEILKHLGVDLPSLATGADPVVSTGAQAASEAAVSDGAGVVRVGLLAAEDCSASAWRALVAAAEMAARSGSDRVGTPHLFWGLNRDPGGALARALQRLQVSLTFGGHLPARAVRVPAEVACSANAGEVLLRAQAFAVGAQRLVSDQDLVAAFVQCEGSSQFLLKQGLVLGALASRLFLDDGGLDLSRFDPAAQAVFEGAVDCAQKKRCPILGRRHLLYGMLVAERGLLPNRIADQGADAELLADQIYALMDTGATRLGSLRPAYPTMSRDLVRVLCAAEDLAEEESSPQIGDSHLLRAWLEDGGGETGAFLARSGVRLRKLI
jgi:hypothetical protein